MRILLAACVALIAGLSPVHAADKPNVLFIAVDDLNDFPAFSKRYPDAKTPHLDRI